MTAPTPIPPSGFAGATPMSAALSYYSLQISGTTPTAQGANIDAVLQGAVNAGLIANGTKLVNKTNGWTISITDNNGNTTHCTSGDWIVVGQDASNNMLSIKLYGGPANAYNNPVYTGNFH